MNGDLPSRLAAVLPDICRRADQMDVDGEWPADDLRQLAEVGILRLALPAPLGAGSSAMEQHLIYEAAARASLSVALIISQRDAAIGLIESSLSATRDTLLEQLASGGLTTVGVAQLTTSRQSGAPALRAVPQGDGYRLNGLIPWCTGAAKADFIVAGAAIEDGRHLLFVLRPDAPGVRVDPPLPLVALRSTWTTVLHCDGARISRADLLAGPAPNVLSRRNHLPLGQAYLAMGLCRGGLDLIREHRAASAGSAFNSLEAELARLRSRIIDLSQPGREAEAGQAAAEIRAGCNDLAVRITHAAVALYKGTALLAGHPAQRLAREAMFLLVWSCPNPVIDCTVELLARQGNPVDQEPRSESEIR